MKKSYSLSELIKIVQQELLSLGLTSYTVEIFTCSGLHPIQQYFESCSVKCFDETIARQYLLTAQESATTRGITADKLRNIRKGVELLCEYAKTGTITWKRLTPHTMRQLPEPLLNTLDSFAEYMLENGYRKTTGQGHRSIIKHFLHHIETRNVITISQMTGNDVTAYVSAACKTFSRIADAFSRVRLFLNFLYTTRVTATNFTDLLKMKVPIIKKFYCGFTIDEVMRILSSINLNSPGGKRNYAIFMLAAQTGLRAVDVLSLQFKNVDWEQKEVRLMQSKTKKWIVLPLSIALCNAIARYIVEERPKSNSSYIFLRTRAPFQPLKNRSAYTMIQRAATKAGITWAPGECKGFHSFRRGIGTQLLDAEVSFDTLREIFQHAAIKTTTSYVRTHSGGLANCALPMAGFETSREEYA